MGWHPIRGLGLLGLLGTAVFVATVLALHFLQPGLSPIDGAMSYYVHGAHGWLMTAGLLAIGIGSLAVTIKLARVLDGGRAGIVLLGVWSVGAILGGAFAADPPGAWDKPPSRSGAIHGIAAMMALAAFPAAAVLIARSLRRNTQFERRTAMMDKLSVASVVGYIAFLASLMPVFVRPGPPIMMGLTERILLAIYAAWICVAAIWLLGLCRPVSA